MLVGVSVIHVQFEDSTLLLVSNTFEHPVIKHGSEPLLHNRIEKLSQVNYGLTGKLNSPGSAEITILRDAGLLDGN
jgi:hypothetical protein